MTLDEFRRLNKSKGFHWFDDASMKFFATKIVHWDTATGYFISSELPPFKGVRFSIRKADFETGKVETIGALGQYETLPDAKEALGKL